MTDGYWFTNQQGERIWCASPDSERCGGHGYMTCYCGGDQCYCGNQGEIECFGCVDCDRDDDECFGYPDDELPAQSPSKTVGPSGDTNG